MPVHDAQGDEVFSRLIRRHGTAEDARHLALGDPEAPEVLNCRPDDVRRSR
ncbi:hypothetical protein [Yinghuangia sp. YIM S09857]|uniref:hypothetical protein n=1 Tax=Yinghuangia sp. YIM S09857 TaxID=3436929 RepID=UPI003F534CBF